MKHKPKNKLQYDKHIFFLINNGYKLKSILMIRRLLATGYYYNKHNSPQIIDFIFDDLPF